MANSNYDFHKQEEIWTDLRFNRETYIIVRIDGHNFHKFSAEHHFHKPNDKRALDLMVEAARQVMQVYKGHIPLAYGHSDEFSFMIRSSSDLLSRRVYKITSMLPVIFATSYNSNWDKFFDDSTQGQVTKRKYDAWFDARPKEYANYRSVINYFRWRQVDCHINNLYNTTLHALTGRYMKHELVPSAEKDTGTSNPLKKTPISEWAGDDFLSARDATSKLDGTRSSDKHEILFGYKINYNNELEQFKKGSVLVADCNGAIANLHVDITKGNSFWEQNSHIFDDFIESPKPL